MDRLLYFIFFLSGATGLVYQVIWVRLTGLIFGNTSYSIATVLGAFMAGLALGSWLLGRRVDQNERPLRLYGVLEIGIGISAALVPLAFSLFQTTYWGVAPALREFPGLDGGLRFGASFVILLVPTFFMGGTLPALAKAFTGAAAEIEKKISVLYALNTFGAALGSLIAALFLIPGLGNLRTTFLIAALNIAIGFLAIRISAHRKPASIEDSGDEAAPDPGDIPVVRTRDRLVLMTLGVSGVAAMLYEVAWTRSLTAMIGSSTYAFSIMLVTFLVGIASGSWLAGRLGITPSLRSLGACQLGIALGAVVFLAGYLAAPYLLVALMRALFYSFPAVLTTQFIVSSALMIGATLFMGMAFPVATRLYSNRLTILGRRVGSGYSVNTLGAIVGSLGAGFLLLPNVGTERTILIGLFLNAATALLLLADEKKGRGAFMKWSALALLVVATVSMRGRLFWDPELMDRGILIYSRQFAARPELTIGEHYEDTDLAYFVEGYNATISVRRGENYVGLRTNGKVDASNRDDMMTQLLLGYLPAFYHPAPNRVMVIGFGAGVTNGAAAAVPDVQRIDCIEIEPGVFGAAPWFAEINRKVYENPKLHMTFADARNYLNVTRDQYDVIISEPSNPWIAGVASLFTHEFYERARQVLKPDGVFAQWVQLYELDPQHLKMIFAEFQRTFPEVSVWNTGAGDLVLIGTQKPQEFDVNRVDRIVQSDPAIRRDFREYLHSPDPFGILAYYWLSSEDVKEFAGEAPLRNTDDRLLLEFHAPRMLFSDTRDLNIELLYEAKSGLLPIGANIPDLERAYFAMIEPFVEMSRTNLANQALGLLAMAERKNEGTLHVAMARLNLESDQLEKTQSALAKADEAISENERVLFAEREELWGKLAEKNGAPTEAAQRFKRAVAADDERPELLKRLSEISAQQQRWDEAAGWMERYIAKNPQGIGHFWALLGDYRLASAQTSEGVSALETSLRVDPYTYWAHWRLARLFEERNDRERAVEQLEFLSRYAFDRDADIYQKLATQYRALGRPRDAARVLAKGTRIFPTNTTLYRLYRETLAGNGEKAQVPSKANQPSN